MASRKKRKFNLMSLRISIVLKIIGVLGILFILLIAFMYVVDIPYNKRIKQSEYFYNHVYPTWVALSATPSPTGSDFYANYQPYRSGTEMFNSGVKINLPPGWKVKIDQKIVNNYSEIDIILNPSFIKLAPNEFNWGAFIIQVYPKASSVGEFLKTNYSLYAPHLKISQTGTIGNRESFKIVSDGSAWWGDKPNSWEERDVVIGSKYSYQIGFGNGNLSGAQDNQLTLKQIFPNIVFE